MFPNTASLSVMNDYVKASYQSREIDLPLAIYTAGYVARSFVKLFKYDVCNYLHIAEKYKSFWQLLLTKKKDEKRISYSTEQLIMSFQSSIDFFEI